jgi:hypothetical protein
MTEAQLEAGNIACAHREADDVLTSALSTADLGMRALAWEIKSRVARAGKDRASARMHIDNALAILDKLDIPMAAWHVHRTAGDLCADEGDHRRAGEHRARAKDFILKIADSFDPGEPLRQSFLTVPPVRRVFEYGASA